MTKSLLTIITFLPLLGAILTLLPWGKWFKLDKAREESLIKNGAIAFSLLPLGLAIVLWFAYDKAAGGMQFQVNVPWIPALNINYHMGVDGLSVPLVFLTTFLTTLGLWYSARVIKVRVREFFFLFLLLEMGMLGVFVSLDLVLFYVFWEVGLVPMYFLIGIWGQPKDRPQYSAIKFFLYTLAGSVFMLLAILGIYFTTGTFDMIEAAQAQAVRGQLPAFQPGVLGLLRRFRHQGAELAVPHLVARRPHRRAHGRFGDPGRRPAEARRLRHPAHPPADLPGGVQALRAGGGGPGRHLHRLWRAGLDGAVGHEAADRLLVGEPHGLRAAGRRRGGLRHRHAEVGGRRRDGAQRRGACRCSPTASAPAPCSSWSA